MNYWVDEIEAIGKADAGRLSAEGILTLNDLLRRGQTKAARRQLAVKTDIDESTLLSLCQMAELMQVRGIGVKYAQLLQAAGVEVLVKLRKRDAAGLMEDLINVNDAQKLVKAPPVEAELRRWIAQAEKIVADSKKKPLKKAAQVGR